MDIVKIAAVGIITAFCVILLRETKTEIAVMVSVAGGCIMLLMLVGYFTDIFSTIKKLMESAGIGGTIATVLFKIIGIGYITEFSAGLMEDAGSKPLADKVILGGKVIIMLLSLPIITALFNLISGLLQ